LEEYSDNVHLRTDFHSTLHTRLGHARLGVIQRDSARHKVLLQWIERERQAMEARLFLASERDNRARELGDVTGPHRRKSTSRFAKPVVHNPSGRVVKPKRHTRSVGRVIRSQQHPSTELTTRSGRISRPPQRWAPQ